MLFVSMIDLLFSFLLSMVGSWKLQASNAAASCQDFSSCLQPTGSCRKQQGHRNGIQQDFTTVFEVLDFTDDRALLASKHDHIQSETDRLVTNGSRVGLKEIPPKRKVVRTNAKRQDHMKISNEEAEDEDEHVYLGATMQKDGGDTEDIRNRLNKERGAFFNLLKIWRSNSISCNTKIKLFKTLLRSVLLCGCKAWKITKSEQKKLDSFQCTCLRRILV